MSIFKVIFSAAVISLAAMTSVRSDEISPATLAKTFTAEILSGCLKQFDSQGIKPREELTTESASPEETKFEAMGIKCERVTIKPGPGHVVAPGSKEAPPLQKGCRFLSENTFISVSYTSPQDLRVVVLYPRHNFTFDIDPERVSARASPSVTAVPDFDQLVRTADTAIAVCVER